jgi:hypothetical protein
MKKVLPHNIDDINEGKCDLKIPRIIGIISDVSRCLDGSWIIKLIDPSSKTGINSYVSKECESLHDGLLVEGNSILLENCSIFISKKPFNRMINIVKKNIIAIYTSNNIELIKHENENENIQNNMSLEKTDMVSGNDGNNNNIYQNNTIIHENVNLENYISLDKKTDIVSGHGGNNTISQDNLNRNNIKQKKSID